MDINEIVSVSGVDNLFNFVSLNKDVVVLKSLKDNKPTTFSMSRHNIIYLFRIEIYGTDKNVTLFELFEMMKKSTEIVPELKEDKENMFVYFVKIFPHLDIKRVYHNNLKQIIKWYNIFKSLDIKFS